MTSYGSIKIDLEINESVKFGELIDSLIENGWSLDIDNEIIYLLDGEDSFVDWIHESISNKDKIIKLLYESLRLDKSIGISLRYKNLDHGWLSIIANDLSSIEFHSEVGRKVITDICVTDFSYHIIYIVDSFLKSHLTINNIDCNWFR